MKTGMFSCGRKKLQTVDKQCYGKFSNLCWLTMHEKLWLCDPRL